MPAKGQRRKQQIINTAKRMFIENGFQSTHIGQVCEELSIARGTVYQYFGNKREILYAILENVEEEFDDIFDLDDLDDYLGKNPDTAQLRNFILKRMSECVRSLIAEPIVIKLMFKEIVGIDDEVVEQLNTFLEYVTKILVRDFDLLKERGVYKESMNSRITATTLIGGVLLLVHEYDRKGEDLLKKELLADITDNFLNGVI